MAFWQLSWLSGPRVLRTFCLCLCKFTSCFGPRLGISCCVTNYPQTQKLREQTCISSQCLWVRNQDTVHLGQGLLWVCSQGEGQRRRQFKARLEVDLGPNSLPWLFASFGSSWFLNWGPQLLGGCWLETALCPLPWTSSRQKASKWEDGREGEWEKSQSRMCVPKSQMAGSQGRISSTLVETLQLFSPGAARRFLVYLTSLATAQHTGRPGAKWT